MSLTMDGPKEKAFLGKNDKTNTPSAGVTKKMIEWIHKQLLFVITITFIFGACAGLYGGKMIYESKLGEAVKIGGAVLENKVYDVKIRP